MKDPRNIERRRRETLAEAEMRALSTLGWGPIIEIAMSAFANLKAAFSKDPENRPQANGDASKREPGK